MHVCRKLFSVMGPRTTPMTRGATGNFHFRMKKPSTPVAIITQISKREFRMLYTPARQTILTIGMRICDLRVAILANIPTRGRFKIRSITFPIYMLAIKPQKICGAF